MYRTSLALSFALAFGCAKDEPGAPSGVAGSAQSGGVSGTSGGVSGTSGGTSATSGGVSANTGGTNTTSGGMKGTTGGVNGSTGGAPSTGGGSSTGGAAATGGAATGGQVAATGGAPTGGSGGSTGSPEVHFVGRVDTSDPEAAKFAWSGTGVVASFEGTSVSVSLAGGQEYTVVLDGEVRDKLVPAGGTTSIATGLASGAHTIELYRRTEAAQGDSQFLGFDFGGGTLLAPPPVTRRIEVIGDSITCGYGNEGPDMNCPFSPQTENHYLSYAAIAARELGAELSTVAWSGKGVVCNYGDGADACTNPLPTYYDRILPNDAGSAWDFSRFQPDAVVINLGTNDFSTDVDPSQSEFESGYRALLEHVREQYPNAHILCTNGPMLTGTDLTNVRTYIDSVIGALGDPEISSFEIDAQDGSDGYGCDWHPSLARHEKLAATLSAAIREQLGW